MSLVAIVLAAAAVAAPAPKQHHGCQTDACLERVARKQCSQARPRRCVDRAILTYRLTGWQAAWMRRIPGCETGWDPLAFYPNQRATTPALRAFAIRANRSAGLYQFKPSTWRTTRYARRSIWQAKWNALAAAWMVSQGRTGEWACR